MSKQIKVIEIEFEDQGQDFLKWKIEMESKTFGKVIESDMQNSIWSKFYVLNEPSTMEHIQISKSPEDEVITIKYPIISVKKL